MRVRGDGHQLRATGPAGAQGAGPTGGSPRRHRDPPRACGAPGPGVEVRRRRGHLERAALALAHAHRHELQPVGGVGWHPMAVLLRGPARAVLPARPAVGGGPGEARPAGAVLGREPRTPGRGPLPGVPPEAHHRAPSRLLQHRGPVRWLRLAPTPPGDSRPEPRRRRRPRRGGRDPGPGHVPAGVGGRSGPRRHRATVRARLHDPALPRRGGHQPTHHRGRRSQVGHRGVQGGRSTGGDRAVRAHGGAGLLSTDLRFRGETPSPAEVAALDAALVGAVPGPESRHLLLPALHAVHDVTGWISPGGLDEVCRRLGVAPADAYGVASFYGLFSMEARPSRVVHVCVDLACRMAGSGDVVAGLPAHGTSPTPGGKKARAWDCASGLRRPWR